MATPPPSSQSSPIFPAVETNTLPQDLLLEILPRLPVKSLFRFRSVHTSWQSLFQNPNFISAHSRQSNLLRPRKVLVKGILPDSKEQETLFLSGETLEAVDTSEIYNQVGKGMWLLGSCNGVFCVTDKERNKFLLWNPATREIMVLPPPLIPATKTFCSAVGFGLDPVGGDLKVVRLMFAPYARADLYSLKSHSWKEIRVDLEHLCDYKYYDLMHEGNHAYCNGNYHWMSPCRRMYTFDMTREVFKSSKVPTWMWKICKGFSGCLSAIAIKKPTVEVWSMVGSNNWKLVKKFWPCFEKYRLMMPVLGDDDYDELCLFNVTKQKIWKFPNIGKVWVRQILPYEVNLVSIRNWTGSYIHQA